MANLKLRAFVLYDRGGKIVAGTLIIRTKPPKDGRRWFEVPYERCCSPVIIPSFISGPKKLKAYIKYTNSGTVIPMSVIIRRQRPVDNPQNWVEIPYDICCVFNTTTTTTSSTTTTTTTAP